MKAHTSPRRLPRLLVAALVAVVATIAAAVAIAADPQPAIQTITPTSEKQITNIDVLRQQIRNYYGDPLGTGDVRRRQQLRQRGRAASAGDGRAGSLPGRPRGGTSTRTAKAIVLDVDDTTLATWNYEIFSNWAFNPTTNATFVTGQLFPAGARAWSTW